MPSTVSSFNPRLSTVSIMPGMEARAPERTETSSGFSGSPNRDPTTDSMWSMPASTSAASASGYVRSFS